MDINIVITTACEVRSVRRFLWAKNTRTAEIYIQIGEIYDESVKSDTNVRKWCRLSKECRTNFHRFCSWTSTCSEISQRFYNLLFHLNCLVRWSESTVCQKTKYFMNEWLNELAASFFEEWIQKLVSRYYKCLNKKGYVLTFGKEDLKKIFLPFFNFTPN